MERDRKRYVVQLEILERNAALSDRQAIELLHAELALANNAARFDSLSGDDIAFEVVSRTSPQEGVARYDVELVLRERDPGLDDAGAQELLRRAFQDACNASFFLRICTDEPKPALVSRAPASEHAAA